MIGYSHRNPPRAIELCLLLIKVPARTPHKRTTSIRLNIPRTALIAPVLVPYAFPLIPEWAFARSLEHYTSRYMSKAASSIAPAEHGYTHEAQGSISRSAPNCRRPSRFRWLPALVQVANGATCASLRRHVTLRLRASTSIEVSVCVGACRSKRPPFSKGSKKS